MRIRRQGETLSVRRKQWKCKEGKKRVEKKLERKIGKTKMRRQGETLSVRRKHGKMQESKERKE